MLQNVKASLMRFAAKYAVELIPRHNLPLTILQVRRSSPLLQLQVVPTHLPPVVKVQMIHFLGYIIPLWFLLMVMMIIVVNNRALFGFVQRMEPISYKLQGILARL